MAGVEILTRVSKQENICSKCSIADPDPHYFAGSDNRNLDPLDPDPTVTLFNLYRYLKIIKAILKALLNENTVQFFSFL